MQQNIATSVETLGVDSRTRTKQLGAKEKARKKKCDVTFSAARKHRVFQKIHQVWCEEGSRNQEGVGLALSLFIEVNNLEVEVDLSTLATLFWAEGVWMGKWKKASVEEADLRSADMETSERTCIHV